MVTAAGLHLLACVAPMLAIVSLHHHHVCKLLVKVLICGDEAFRAVEMMCHANLSTKVNCCVVTSRVINYSLS